MRKIDVREMSPLSFVRELVVELIWIGESGVLGGGALACESRARQVQVRGTHLILSVL